MPLSPEQTMETVFPFLASSMAMRHRSASWVMGVDSSSLPG